MTNPLLYFVCCRNYGIRKLYGTDPTRGYLRCNCTKKL